VAHWLILLNHLENILLFAHGIKVEFDFNIVGANFGKLFIRYLSIAIAVRETDENVDLERR